jgi:hypothetical protein
MSRVSLDRFVKALSGYVTEDLFGVTRTACETALDAATRALDPLDPQALTPHREELRNLRAQLTKADKLSGTDRKAAFQSLELTKTAAEVLQGNAVPDALAYSNAKKAYEKDYPPLKDDITAITTAWGDAIPQSLKDKRTGVQSANGLVTAEASKFDYVNAVAKLTSLKLAEKVNAAKLAKQQFDDAKIVFERDYGAIRADIGTIISDTEANVSQTLKDKRTAVTTANAQIPAKETALDYPAAVQLMTSQNLATKVTEAKQARTAFDTAKAKYATDYTTALSADINTILTGWDAQIAATVKATQTAVKNANKIVVDDANLFAFEKAVASITSQTLPQKVNTATAAKLASDRDKAASLTAFSEATKRVKELGNLKSLHLVGNEKKAAEDNLKAANATWHTYRFADAKLEYEAVIQECIDVRRIAAEGAYNEVLAKYNTSMNAPSLKTHPKKDAVKTALQKELDTLKADLDKAKSEFDADRLNSSDKISDRVYFACDRVVALADKHAAYATAHDAAKSLVDALPATNTTIAPDLTTLTGKLAAAEKKAGKRLYDPAAALLKEVTAGAGVAKKTVEDHTPYAAKLEEVQLAVAALPATLVPIQEILTAISTAKDKAIEAAGKRDYTAAMSLLAEAAKDCTLAKQIAEDQKANADLKQSALAGDPTAGITELRKAWKKLSDHAQAESVKTELANMKIKLDDAEKALAS